MEAMLICGPGQTKVAFDGTEGGLAQEIGKVFKWVPVPGSLTVKVGTRTVIIDRSYNKYNQIDNKISYTDLEGLAPSIYPWKMLRKVDPVTNAYQSFEMKTHDLGNRTISFSISKGRIGAEATDIDRIKETNRQYDPLLFWCTYYQKLEEGYEDYSDSIGRNLPEPPVLYAKYKKTEVKTVSQDAASDLYNILLKAATDFAQEILDDSILNAKAPFTQKQIEAAREIWNTLGKSRNVDQFNSKIRKILALAPRRINAYYGQTVKSYLAQEVADPEKQTEIFSAIIDREDTLIRSMEAIFLSSVAEENTTASTQQNCFPGINVCEATDTEIQYIKDTMFNADKASQGLKERVYRVWKINSPAQDKKFKEYVEARKCPQTKLLFHGSRTANWISIITNSLQLNPNAQINGKAFGYGIYFALSADKSFGYTSISNRWTSDGLSSGFMGIYETAYGRACDSSKVAERTQAWMDKNGYDCLHYHAGHDTDYSFVRDEIVFYSESAMALRYLIEFR